MPGPQMVVRIAANTAELRANLLEGKAQIEALGPSVAKMAATWSANSATLIQNAQNITAAIATVGASTLTAADAAKNLKTLDAAMAQMKSTGQGIPPLMQQTADKLRAIPPLADDAAKKTANFSEQLGQANQLLNAFGVGLSIGAIAAFAEKVVDAGASIEKMAQQTDMSVAQVQRLQYIAGQTDTSVETLVGAVQNLQQRIGTGNTGAVRAFAELNINLDTFNKLGSYDQMTMLSDAIRGIQDPTKRSALEFELFGKSWKEIAPAMLGDMRAIGDQAPIMADSTVASLKRIHDTLASGQQTATAWGGAFVLAIEGAGFAVGDFLSKFDPSHFGVANSQLLALETAAAKNESQSSAVPVPVLATNNALGKLSLTTSQATLISKELTKSAEASIVVNEKSAASVAKVATATQAGIDQASQLWDQYFQLVDKGEGNSLAAKLRADQTWYDGEVDKLNRTKSLNLNYWNDLEAAGAVFDAKVAADEQEAFAKITNISNANLDRVLETLGTKLPPLKNDFSNLAAGVGVFEGSLHTLPDSMAPVLTYTANWGQQLDDLANQFQRLSQVAGASFSGIVKDIANVVTSTAMGYQSMKAYEKAATDTEKAIAAVGMASSVLQATGSGSAESRVAGGALTGAEAGAEIGGTSAGIYGAAIGAGVGALVGWARSTGPSEAELAGRQVEAAFEKGFGGYDAMMGKIGAAYDLVGSSGRSASGDIQRVWDAETQGADATNAAIDNITKMLALADEKTKAIETSFEGVQTAGKAAFGVLTPAIRDHIADLLTMNNLTDDQRTALQGMLGEGQTDYRGLVDAASKYGITLTGLGPKFEQNVENLNWSDLNNTWQELISAGGDYGGMLKDASGGIGDMVTASRNAGTSIPEYMRPMLQSMVDAGELTDGAGGHLKDLSALTFAPTDPLPTALDNLDNTLQTLIDTLIGKDGITAALAAVNATPLNNKHAEYTFTPGNTPGVGPGHYDDIGNWVPDPSGAAMGGLVTAAGVIYAARGRVIPFIPRGTDTVPAMLTPGEGVVSVPEMHALGGPVGFNALRASLRAGAGSMLNRGEAPSVGGKTEIHVHVEMDGREVAEAIFPYTPAVAKRYGVA